MSKNDPLEQEHRKYIRLDSVFPVEFRIVSLDGEKFLSDWLQGFTRNIGRGGICLEVNNLALGLANLVKKREAKLSLKIEMPVARSPLKAVAGVVWVKDAVDAPNKYTVGLSYEEIDPRQNNKIIRYARMKKLFVPLVLATIVFLSLGLITYSYINMKLIRANKIIVEQLVRTIQESSAAKERIKKISKERLALQQKIHKLSLRIETVEKKKVEKLIQEKTALEDKLALLGQKESVVSDELLRLDKRKANLEKANIDNMYHWLIIHQNPRTGLVMSFEGDNEVADWAFIYDQSLAAQGYMMFSDFDRTKKILDFFSRRARKSEEKLFYNAYYVNDGAPVEYIVHSGPNIWLGIAVLQYTEKTRDRAYLNLAEEIAQAIIYLQSQDKEGGIRGGPNVNWYSTEHNLDAYAFFGMLYSITGKELYRATKEAVLKWLLLHTYDKENLPVLRGKGDSTIATDTYAWSIASIGPEKLKELGMNPDRILEFAEENCAVEVDYMRPEGRTVKIKGFDFAAQKNVSRGGVVSSELTAQMAISFKIMAGYYYKKNMIAKARSYDAKAEAYLATLGKMIIASPSPSGQGDSCLPYATQENVDTGHGWVTPKGKSTGSLSGTVYTIFAYYNYNPLKFKR